MFGGVTRPAGAADDKAARKVGDGCPAYAVSGPTVIGFLDPANRDKDPHFSDVLTDFRASLKRLRERLGGDRIQVHECYQRSFETRVGSKRRKFVADSEGVGYYFASPTQEPRIERGVMTVDDLVDVMKEYFGADVVRQANRKR